MNILFVCTGNTCRSPLAAEIGRVMAQDRGLDYTFESAGIYADADCYPSIGAVEAAESFGGDLTGHRAMSVNRGMMEEADAVLTMTSVHKRTLLSQYPEFAEKIFTFKEYAGKSGDIEDPFGQDTEVYQKVAEDIAGLLNAILK